MALRRSRIESIESALFVLGGVLLVLGIVDTFF